VAKLLLEHGDGPVRSPHHRVAHRTRRPRCCGRSCGGRRKPLRGARWGGHLLLSLVFAQIALGIATLVNVVPLPLAAMHQAGAVLVFAAALNVAHALR
jgi:hypothetical protein